MSGPTFGALHIGAGSVRPVRLPFLTPGERVVHRWILR